MILLKHILVATDFSDPSEVALEYGRALARSFGASLHLLHVMENLFLRPVPGDPYVLKAAAHKQLDERLTHDDRASLHALASIETADNPADAIVKYAQAHDIELIVMGTHGRSTMARLFVGSVAERVVRMAPCPVLTVRHPEHEFVVPDAPGTTEKAGGLS